MNDLPPPPPTAEGELIRQARDLAIPKLSIRAAAARAGISPEQWGNIERSYRYTRPGDPVRPFIGAPAATIAKMARVVGVTPTQLSGAGREDAARMLEAMQRRDAAAAADEIKVLRREDSAALQPRPDPPPRRDVDFGAGVDEAELRPFIEDVLQQAFEALQRLYPDPLPGPDDPDVRQAMLALPGSEVFPDVKHEASIWNDPRYSPRERVDLVARLRWLSAKMATEERRRSGTGLGHYPATGAVAALVSVAGMATRASH